MEQKTVLQEVDIDLYGEPRQLTPEELETLSDMVQVMRERRAEHQNDSGSHH